MESWVWDVIRIVVVSLVGAVMMFLIQPWLYQNGVIALNDVEPETWVGNNYINGAFTVFLVSIIAVILWYAIAAKAKVQRARETSSMAIVWWIILLMPVISICAAIYLFNNSNDALLSLTGFFIFDVLLIYWFSTAISSPRSLMFVVPGAFFLRNLFGLR